MDNLSCTGSSLYYGIKLTRTLSNKIKEDLFKCKIEGELQKQKNGAYLFSS